MADKRKSGGSKVKGQALRDFRHSVSVLKSKGIVSKRVDARSQAPTRYMQSKVRKFTDVLEGKVTAVRARPDIRAKYEGILEIRGAYLVVPKERERERGRIARGLVEIERPIIGRDGLSYGEERELILPFKIVDMQNLVSRLQEDESLDGLKEGDEMFAFKIDGWSSKIGFPDAKEMGDYISLNYAHLFKPGMTRRVIKYLTFVRYKSHAGGRAHEGDHRGTLPNKKRHHRKTSKWDKQRQRDNDAKRKARARAKETQSEREARLAKNAHRTAQWRQRKFEG